MENTVAVQEGVNIESVNAEMEVFRLLMAEKGVDAGDWKSVYDRVLPVFYVLMDLERGYLREPESVSTLRNYHGTFNWSTAVIEEGIKGVTDMLDLLNTELTPAVSALLSTTKVTDLKKIHEALPTDSFVLHLCNQYAFSIKGVHTPNMHFMHEIDTQRAKYRNFLAKSRSMLELSHAERVDKLGFTPKHVQTVCYSLLSDPSKGFDRSLRSTEELVLKLAKGEKNSSQYRALVYVLFQLLQGYGAGRELSAFTSWIYMTEEIQERAKETSNE